MKHEQETYSPMLELQKFAVEWIRKQGGNVVLLSLGIVWIWYYTQAEITDLKSQKEKQAIRVEELVEEIRKCDTERARLESRVEWLVSELSQRFPKLKKYSNEH